MTINGSRRALLAKLVGLSAALGAATCAPRLSAHRAHVTLTRLTANPAAGSWEMVHSIHYHDAAVALRRLAPGEGLQPTSPKGQARLMLEIERTMRWLDPAGNALSPRAVGAELAADAVVLYQELSTPAASGRYQLESRFLFDVFPEQRHNLSVELAGDKVALTLNANTPRATFEVGG